MAVIVRHLGLCDYTPVYQAMQDFNAARDPNTEDEIWLLEHQPVFTLGLNGRPEHVLDPGDIPVLQTDRGGQVTYHGPGQLVAYLLLDVKRNRLGVRQMVSALEQSVIDLLQDEQIQACARPDAPGVYVDGAKVAALGLRVKRGATYHGLSLNLDMDLGPFQRINPCGYPGMEVINLRDLGLGYTMQQLSERLLDKLCKRFHIDEIKTDYE